MPFEDEDYVLLKESDFDRTARAVRYVERLMQIPERADHAVNGRSVEALVSITKDPRRPDGKYKGYIYYKSQTASTATPALPPTPNPNLANYGQMPDSEFVKYDEEVLVMDINKGLLYPNQFYKGMIQTNFEGYPLVLVTAVPRAFNYSNRGYSNLSDDGPDDGVILKFRSEWNTGCRESGNVEMDIIEYTIALLLADGVLTGSISMSIIEEDRIVVETECKEFLTADSTVECVDGVITYTWVTDFIKGIACGGCP